MYALIQIPDVSVPSKIEQKQLQDAFEIIELIEIESNVGSRSSG